jgi:hypothetical protein
MLSLTVLPLSLNILLPSFLGITADWLPFLYLRTLAALCCLWGHLISTLMINICIVDVCSTRYASEQKTLGRVIQPHVYHVMLVARLELC